MKIALIGYGKMGQMFEAVALKRGLEVVERFMDVHPLKTDSETRKKLKSVSVLVDFSVPSAVMNNVQAACDLGIPLVEGTTGWHDRLGEVKEKVQKAGIGMVHASNFSLGVNVFFNIVDRAAQLFLPFGQYDPYIEESHHKHKLDAPSGTAVVLKQIVEAHYRGTAVSIASVRAGYMPGQHAVSFDSAADTVRLEHTARNREGLAEGAVLSARWIAGKKGFFNFRDIVEQMMQSPARGDAITDWQSHE